MWILIKKIPVFRVIRPYLNLLVKHIVFSGYWEKKWLKKYVFLPYLKFSDLLPDTHLFFLFGLIKWHFQKPADLDLHCFQGGKSRFSRTRVIKNYNSTGLPIRVLIGKLVSLFLIQTYVVGTQKNRLNDLIWTYDSILFWNISFFCT